MFIESKSNPFVRSTRFVCMAFIISVLFSMMFSGIVCAAEKTAAKPEPAADSRDDAKRAKELLDRAVAYYREKKDLALAAFMRQGEFIQGDLYVYVINTNGVMLSSGGSSSALIGSNITNLRDAEGKPFFREMLDIAKSQSAGSVEYRWQNRADRKVERKLAYFQKVGDAILSVGYYIPRASAKQAKDMLNRAAEAVKSDPESAFKAFGDLGGKYIEDDLYVFVVDIDKMLFRAHGASPRLVGSDAQTLNDPTGKPIIREMVSIVKAKGQGELDYVWRNPVTNKNEKKHTFVRKVGNFLVGVGYYAR